MFLRQAPALWRPVCTSRILEMQAVALQVVEDFAADNVVYLELRTTPKVQSPFRGGSTPTA